MTTTLAGPVTPKVVAELEPFMTADEKEELDQLLEEEGPAPLVEYQTRPIDYLVDRLGFTRESLEWSCTFDRNGIQSAYAAHVWDGTKDPLAVICRALAAGHNVGAESGTGTGKTRLGAGLVLWFLDCFMNAIVVTVAPKEDQLKLHIWKEIGVLWPRFQEHRPEAELSHLRIRMKPGKDDWSAVGFICGVAADEQSRSATRAQGFHAEHMMILFEETPGIHPAIMTAFKNTCTAPHNLRMALGNPDHRLDELHKFCKSSGVVHVQISALDHPNVVTNDHSRVPGAVSRKSVDEREADYGLDDPMYQSRVRGLSPAEAPDALIKLSWLEQAAKLYKEAAEKGELGGGRALGIDVAESPTGDKCAIARFRGNACYDLEAKHCPRDKHGRASANEFGRELVKEIKKDAVPPDNIGIDPIGVGSGAVNTLWDEGILGVQSVNFASAAYAGDMKGADGETREWLPDSNLFFNLRGQAYWLTRDDLRHGRLLINGEHPLFKQLCLELTTPKWMRKHGQVKVEEKLEIRKRLGGASVDLGDAFVTGNFVRTRAAARVEARPDPVIPDRDPRHRTFTPENDRTIEQLQTFDGLPLGF